LTIGITSNEFTARLLARQLNRAEAKE